MSGRTTRRRRSLARRLARPGVASLIGSLLLFVAATSTRGADDPFDGQVAPTLVRRCLECHRGPDAAGGLRLDSAAGLQQGGESGPAIVAGKPEQSRLFERIAAGEMPPPKQGRPRPLPAEEREAIRRWIAAGAAWPADRTLDPYERTTDARGGRDWWSLQAVARPATPDAARPDRPIANPIDAFLLARLDAAGLVPAPPAEPRTLLRRLHYDLIGLPPTFEQLEQFAADPSPAAYERQVDRLLDSPHFGERQARRWLDLVRYADTCGYERDQEKPLAWKYRDWVVGAFNDDLPFDQFVVRQLAGDELPDRRESDVVATGFLRLGTWNDEPNDAQEYKYERLEDLVHVTSTAFLGLTVKCARCHDHKFDPIPQLDYYRVAAAFWAGPIEPRDAKLLGGPTRDELGFDLLGWTDLGPRPPPFRWLRKGDPRLPQEPVEPGFLTALPAVDRPSVPPPDGAKTSGRRLQLARRIVDPRNPLTPRVAVNRLWLQHFGRALVRSPDNFGFTGERPTHPELLDWLAAELVEGGWRLKRLHKLMVMSDAYRRSSVHPLEADCRERDAENRLWWRAERRRLDAESLRDSILVAAGRLDLRLGGPGFKPSIAAEALEGLSRKSGAWTPSPAGEQRRRSLYIYSQRSLLPPLMTTFDFCDTTQPCGQRDVSIVAPQALALLNNPFLHEQAAALAERTATAAGDDATPPRTAGLAWRLTLGRDPTPVELQATVEHLQDQTRRYSDSAATAPSDVADPAAVADDSDTEAPPVRRDLALHLTAGKGVERDAAGRVLRWADQSGRDRHAAQEVAERRPAVAAKAIGGRDALEFDGRARDLRIAGQVLTSPRFTLFVVATDAGRGAHRELFSNWDGAAGNSTRSVFLGTTGDASVRFSDDFAPAGALVDPARPFLLAALASADDAIVWQGRTELAKLGRPLAPRNLATSYVVGQQGNIQGEYWHGLIAELIVYDRALEPAERLAVTRRLEAKYGLAATGPQVAPARRALESLCLVLLNSNEFLYVD